MKLTEALKHIIDEVEKHGANPEVSSVNVLIITPDSTSDFVFTGLMTSPETCAAVCRAYLARITVGDVKVKKDQDSELEYKPPHWADPK